MKAALDAMQNGTSLRKACVEFHVPKTTLRRRFNDKNKFATGHAKIMGNYKVRCHTKIISI